MAYLEDDIRRYVGLSSDTKPSLDTKDVGSYFFETDTGTNYIYNGSEWLRHNTNTKISFDDTESVDSFGRLSVARPINIFDNKNIHDRHEALWEEPIVGSIIVHGTVTAGPFQVAETITGGTSGNIGTVTAVDAGALTITYIVNHNDFVAGETITGSISGASATVTTFNTGSHVSHDRNTASVILQAGINNGDQAVRQTHRYFTYIPGKAQELGVTFLFGAAVTNIRRRVGYFDLENGIFLEQTTSGISFTVRSSTSGSPVDTQVLQSAWNMDKMDGTGPSRLNLDFTNVQFLIIDFQWQGTGRVRCGFFYNGKKYVAHEFLYSNVISTAYSSTPSLPVRFEITNTGGTASVYTMSEICTALVSSEGDNPNGLGFSVSNDITVRNIDAAAEYPILALRLKNTHPKGGANRVTVELSNMSAFATGNSLHYEVRHLHDPTGITATWADAGDGSACEYSTNITAITGNPTHKIEEGYIAAGSAGKGGGGTEIVGDKLDQHRYLSQNYDSTNSECFVIFAQSLTGNAGVYAHISWVEFD